MITEETRRKMSEAHKGKKKSEETRRKMSEAHKGKGAEVGHRIETTKGYVGIKVPNDHKSPSVSKTGYEYEHRYVMEMNLNRYLHNNESVRHLNGNKRDNRIENLQLITHSEHSRILIKTTHQVMRERFKEIREKRANTIFWKDGQPYKWDSDGRKCSVMEANRDLYDSYLKPQKRQQIKESLQGKKRGTYERKRATREYHHWTYYRYGKEIDVRTEAAIEDVTPQNIINRCRYETMGYSRKKVLVSLPYSV